MEVEVVSQQMKYSISYTELCKKFGISNSDEVDFVDVTLDPNKELVIIEQIEPPHVDRPEGD